MKTLKKLSREELKQIKGGVAELKHYYCICSNGKTINGSYSNQEQVDAIIERICTGGDPNVTASAECFD